MDEQELDTKLNKITDDFKGKAFQKGREAINVLGENFKKYLTIMVKDGLTNPTEMAIIFGMFLMAENINQDGYKLISKNKFSNFYQKYKKEIKKLMNIEENK